MGAHREGMGTCIGGLGVARCGRTSVGLCEVVWRQCGGSVEAAYWQVGHGGAESAPLGGRHVDGAWDIAPVRGAFFGMGGMSVEEGVAAKDRHGYR